MYFFSASVTDRFAPSYRIELFCRCFSIRNVLIFCYVLMIAMLLSCLSLCRHSKFISECYSLMYLLLYSKFKIIYVTARPTWRCFQVISVSGRFTESYFVTVPPFDIISDADHLAPNSCCVELLCRLIATVRIDHFTVVCLVI